MSVVGSAAPAFGGYQSLRRFSVDEYHRMIQAGILDEDDPVELLEGYVVLKMPRNPPHDTALQLVRKRIEALLQPGWDTRIQSAVTLPDSEPEPDVAVVRGDERTYATRHPGPADVGLLVEVSDSTLQRDRDDKGRIYARAGIPAYWIVNLIDRQVEVLSGPSGPAPTPAYVQRQVFPGGTAVALVLDGNVIGAVAVQSLLP
jgi:Uma2 family endonuclease